MQYQLEVEDKDEEIFAYLENNNLFSVMGYKIEFSNGSIAYVKNSEDFMSARDDFVLNYFESDGVDPIETKKQLDGNKTTTYSKEERRDISYKYLDTADISYELIPIDLTLKTYDECITWLSFGYDYDPKYYAVEEGDMIEGVAYKNSISVMNLLSINSDKLKSPTQLLQVGEELTVSFDIDAREWQGRWFNSIRAWKVERANVQQPMPADGGVPFPPPSAVPVDFSASEEKDDLPF